MDHELKIIDRNGKASLWVGKLNIWDIQHRECTPNVLDAIRSAYERGRQTAVMDSNLIAVKYPVSYEWLDERKAQKS